MSQPAPHKGITVITVSFWQSRALAVAAERKIVNYIAGALLSFDELAMSSGINPANLRRLLQTLETTGIF